MLPKKTNSPKRRNEHIRLAKSFKSSERQRTVATLQSFTQPYSKPQITLYTGVVAADKVHSGMTGHLSSQITIQVVYTAADWVHC